MFRDACTYVIGEALMGLLRFVLITTLVLSGALMSLRSAPFSPPDIGLPKTEPKSESFPDGGQTEEVASPPTGPGSELEALIISMLAQESTEQDTGRNPILRL